MRKRKGKQGYSCSSRDYLLRIKTAIGLLGFVVLFGVSTHSNADDFQCGPVDTAGYGPYDYRKRALFTTELSLVESAHFTRDVQTLTRGATAAVGGDLHYTLRAIPNHHIALRTMVRYYTEKVQPPRAPMPASAYCYFDWAVRYAPDDAVVWLLRGMYTLEKEGSAEKERATEALEYFERANSLAPTDPEVQYNLGVMKLRLNKQADALAHAQIAYRGGYPLPGLRQRLQSLGIWKESAE